MKLDEPFGFRPVPGFERTKKRPVLLLRLLTPPYREIKANIAIEFVPIDANGFEKARPAACSVDRVMKRAIER